VCHGIELLKLVSQEWQVELGTIEGDQQRILGSDALKLVEILALNKRVKPAFSEENVVCDRGDVSWKSFFWLHRHVDRWLPPFGRSRVGNWLGAY